MLLHVHVQTAGLENQCMMILFYGYILSYIYIMVKLHGIVGYGLIWLMVIQLNLTS